MATSLSAQREENKKKSKELYDKQAAAVNANADASIKDVGTAYDDQQRTIAVQKLINERKVAESMANLGSTDSGLNRTQQTAVQLSAANAGYELNRQKQADISKINLQRDNSLSEIEQNRIATEMEINNTYDALEAEERAAKAKAAAEQVSANNAAIEKYTQAKNTDVSKLFKHISETNPEPDDAAQLIDALGNKYDDISNTELSVLLRAAGLTTDEYENYIKNGSIYSSNKYSASSKDGGRVLGDYKTLGTQNYKIKVVKDTFNWGWGVDNNDIVDIYYPDGTLLKKNVKLSDLTRSVGLKLTEKTKGNKGKELVLSLDLSKEKLD